MKVTVTRSISAEHSWYPDEIKRIQDVYDTWIIENLGYRIVPNQNLNAVSFDNCSIEFTYVFKCEEDVVAFKLRWT